MRFSAEVEIDDKPGGKRFQGVWLVREDGQRWVTAYRALGFWKVFEGTTVNVVGSKYRPRGQAIGATHFQVETLTVDPQLGTPWIGLGPKETLMGHFQQETGAAGTKLEGETWVVFISDANASYQLANTIEVGELNRPVQVTARAMT
ncbi:MAG: hypothetical protein ACPG4T_10805 [Nannocystaceae bacterium]